MAVLGLLCGCSGDDDAPKRGSAPPPQRCELVARDQQVFVRLTGTRARELCADWSQPGAPGDWTEPSSSAEPDQAFDRMCVLYRGRSAAGLYAADSISSVARAKRFCIRLLQDGWGELGRPDPALAEDHPAPNADLPVRCAEGRCLQRGRRVGRPATGAACPGGRWSFTLSRDQNFGVYRCRPISP
jgi:hypothetical protein